MLLTEDGHLDIERVKQLSEEEFADEAETWGVEQFCEWNGIEGRLVTLEEFAEKYHLKIREMWHEDENEETDNEGSEPAD